MPKKFSTFLLENSANAERDAAFNQLGKLQRHKPEMAMLRAQDGGKPCKEAEQYVHDGVEATRGYLPSYNAFTWALEHIGDITHRMTEHFSSFKGQPSNVLAKVKRGLAVVQNPIDSYRIKRLPEFPEFEAYSREHEQLPAYNDAQRHARNAAIALGRRDFPKVIHHLSHLKDMIEGGTYYDEASKYDPNFEVPK